MTTTRAPLAECVKHALVKRARYAFPFEACGFIMNSADPDSEQFVFAVPNVAKNRRHSWQMDPDYQAMAFRDEENIFGIWHSHPSGPDGPSETDFKYMIPGQRFFVVTINGVFEYEMRSS